MKEIDFTKIQIVGSFEDEAAGKTRPVNIAKPLGNLMKFSGSILLDIGWEDLAREIYYSEGPVKVEDKYAPEIINIIREHPIVNAATKRALIDLLK